MPPANIALYSWFAVSHNGGGATMRMAGGSADPSRSAFSWISDTSRRMPCIAATAVPAMAGFMSLVPRSRITRSTGACV